MNTTVTVAAKECSRCGETKPATDFYRARGMKTGLTSKCKDCTNDYLKEYRARPDAHERERAHARRRDRERRLELNWYRRHYPQDGQPWLEATE